jgi:tetratricopeptide (TPR) repeat protein
VEARKHFLEAAAIDPESALIERELSRLHLFWRHLDEALAHVDRALILEPGNPDGLCLLGQIRLARGEVQPASDAARTALEADPEHLDSIVLLGDCDLRKGNVDAAREHAIWALQLDPNDEGARHLLSAIKARTSLLLGLWWRFQTFVGSGTEIRSITVLLTMYLVYRATAIVLEAQGQTALSNALPYAWLAFCAYTWVAPGLFLRALEKEMAQVRLRPEF